MFRSTLEEHEQIDPAEALMREVGAQLRQARAERGEDLPQIAENLRIKPAYLEAIERGDLSTMPGRTYALGFLRSYAEYLGFDGDDLIRQIKSTVENLTDRARLHIPAPLPESRLPKTSLVVLSLALVGGVYAGWMYLSDQQRHLDVETVAEVPDDFQQRVLGSLPTVQSAQKPESPVTGPAASTDRAVPAEPAAPLDERVEMSDFERPQAAEPEIQAGLGDEARSDDRARLPSARRQSPTTTAAAEIPAVQPFGIDPPPISVREYETAGSRGDATDPGSVAAARALDRIIEGEDAGSAEAAGDGRSRPDASDDRPNATTGAEATPMRSDEPSIAPDAGPGQQAGSEQDDLALSSGRAEAGSPIDADVRGDDAPGAAQSVPASEAAGLDAAQPGPRKSAEEVLSALARTGTASEGTLQVYERENTDARVVIRAHGRSWIRITSESGDYIRTRTLEEDDVFLVPDRADLTLWTGNAGGIQVIVDGQTLPPMGPDGKVRKNVSLDPESLLAQADVERREP